MPENNKEVKAGQEQEAEKLLVANVQSNEAQQNNNSAASEEEAENLKKEMAKIEARLLELELRLKNSQDNGNKDEIDKTKEEIAAVGQEKMKCYSKICSHDKDIANVNGTLLFYNHDKFTDYVDELKSFHEKLGLRYEIKEKIDEKTSAPTTVFVTFTPEKFDHKDLTELTAADLREIHNSYKEDDRKNEKDDAKSDTNTKLAKEDAVDKKNDPKISNSSGDKKNENEDLNKALKEVEATLARNRDERNRDEKGKGKERDNYKEKEKKDKDKDKEKEEEKKSNQPDDNTFTEVREGIERDKLEQTKSDLEKQRDATLGHQAVGTWAASILNQREGSRSEGSRSEETHSLDPQPNSQQDGNFSWIAMVKHQREQQRNQENQGHGGHE